MYDAANASHIPPGAGLQRARGKARVAFRLDGTDTRLSDLFQSGSAKIRLPRVYNQPKTAVLINTAGGLTGGDTFAYEAEAGPGVHAIVTTQTAERAYRSAGGTARVSMTISAEDGATFEWLPQETILFDHSSLGRSLRADLTGTGRLLALETVVLGRKAMGETVGQVFFRDSWRIHRDGKLVFADDVRISGDSVAALSGRATGGGARAFATLVDCGPMAEDRLDLARGLMAAPGDSTVKTACSAWNGMLVARCVAAESRHLRDFLTTFLTKYRSADLPRVWHC